MDASDTSLVSAFPSVAGIDTRDVSKGMTVKWSSSSIQRGCACELSLLLLLLLLRGCPADGCVIPVVLLTYRCELNRRNRG